MLELPVNTRNKFLRSNNPRIRKIPRPLPKPVDAADIKIALLYFFFFLSVCVCVGLWKKIRSLICFPITASKKTSHPNPSPLWAFAHAGTVQLHLLFFTFYTEFLQSEIGGKNPSMLFFTSSRIWWQRLKPAEYYRFKYLNLSRCSLAMPP
jgi:hypothetical protein